MTKKLETLDCVSVKRRAQSLPPRLALRTSRRFTPEHHQSNFESASRPRPWQHLSIPGQVPLTDLVEGIRVRLA